MRTFKLPDPGEGIGEAEILEVRVAPGDTVADGQVVLVIETDKAAVEVPAPRAGTIASVAVSEGDVVPVGQTLLTYAEGNDSHDGDDEARAAPRSEDAATRRESGSEPVEAHRERSSTDEPEVTPAEDMPAEEGVRVTDDEAPSRRDDDVLASPATRKLARELDVDLSRLAGQDNGARITAADVRAAAEEAPAPQKDDASAGDRRASHQKDARRDESTPGGEDKRIKLRSVRRTVARRMARAWDEIPHVSHTVSIDITELERFRNRMAETVGGLTLTVVLCKALAATLVRHPRFNAELDAHSEEIVLHQQRHIGVAVDTDNGLLVPVLRDVDRRSLAALADELAVLSEKARAGKLAVREMRGATFTVTNIGSRGGEHFTPIINHPQAAILGAAQAAERPQQGDDGELIWRLHLPLVLSFDHRLNDGMDAARFFGTLAPMLEDPARFAAEV